MVRGRGGFDIDHRKSTLVRGSVHASQGLKVGLYTSTILGGNSYLSWFYDRGAIKDPAHTGTTKGLSQAINRGPIRTFLPKYANVYVTIQSHGLSAGVWSHYVTAYGVRDGLDLPSRDDRGYRHWTTILYIVGAFQRWLQVKPV